MKICKLVCLFAVAAVTAFAQSSPVVDLFADALALRQEVTASLLQGESKPNQAMARLRAHASPSGLKVDREADFAMAAIAVGLRLLAAEQPARAEEFFLAAENALEKAVQKTKDESAAEKSLYLQQLAFIRGNFLNKPEAARDDVEAALKLRPDDPHLTALKANLLRTKGVRGKGTPTQ